MDKKQLRNTLMLMACAFIWGTAFVAQSVGSDYMGPYTFLASRSWLACAFLLGLMAVLRKMGKTNPAAEPGFWQNKKVDFYILIKMEVSVILCTGSITFNTSFRNIIILIKYRCLSLQHMVEL